MFEEAEQAKTISCRAGGFVMDVYGTCLPHWYSLGHEHHKTVILLFINLRGRRVSMAVGRVRIGLL